MKPIRKSRWLIPVVLVSGCFQAEAPRHETSGAAAAESVVQRLAAQRPIDVPVKEVPASVAQLETVLHEAADPAVRREALYQIADAGEMQDAALIGRALYDPDSRVRKAAVEALTGIGGESSADWMLVALGDSDPGIRRMATEALGEIGGETAKSLLQQGLMDAADRVREAAQQALAEPGFSEPELR
jgi:HEAT repeat protein